MQMGGVVLDDCNNSNHEDTKFRHEVIRRKPRRFDFPCAFTPVVVEEFWGPRLHRRLQKAAFRENNG